MTRVKILIFVCFYLIVSPVAICSASKTRSSCSSWWSRWDCPAIILGGGYGSTAGVLFTKSFSLLDIPKLIICWFGWWRFGSCCRWSLICAPDILFLKSSSLSCFFFLRSSFESLAKSSKRYSSTVPHPAIDLSAVIRNLFHFSISSLMNLANFDALICHLSQILSLKSNCIWLLL